MVRVDRATKIYKDYRRQGQIQNGAFKHFLNEPTTAGNNHQALISFTSPNFAFYCSCEAACLWTIGATNGLQKCSFTFYITFIFAVRIFYEHVRTASVTKFKRRALSLHHKGRLSSGSFSNGARFQTVVLPPQFRDCHNVTQSHLGI